jgi:type I restriction enzyme S subunit
MMDNEQLPKGYKNTEVGVIPEDWEVKAIGKYTDVTSGGTPSTLIREYWDGPIRWMNSGELNLKIVYEVENRITELGLNESATKLVPKNCVLIGLAGQGKTRGTVAINKVELCTNQSIAAILPSDEVFYEYLYYNLDSRYFELRGLSTGDGGRGGLNLTIIKNLLIPLPPTKAEQTAIATALSDADALINSLEKLIAKKRNIKQGAMQHLLKPKEGWEVKKLGEIAAFFKGKGLPKSHLKENGKYKCIHYGELFTKYKESISSILSYTNENENCFFSISNDVLMPTSDVTPNGLATASCIKQDGIILGGDVLVIRILPSILDGLFLSFYVSQNREKVMKLVSGSTVYHLYGSDMKDFEISYPKTEQQNEIATILSDMDAEIQALETKLEKYRKIKLGMMQVLLTGKVRLV